MTATGRNAPAQEVSGCQSGSHVELGKEGASREAVVTFSGRGSGVTHDENTEQQIFKEGPQMGNSAETKVGSCVLPCLLSAPGSWSFLLLRGREVIKLTYRNPSGHRTTQPTRASQSVVPGPAASTSPWISLEMPVLEYREQSVSSDTSHSGRHWFPRKLLFK